MHRLKSIRDTVINIDNTFNKRKEVGETPIQFLGRLVEVRSVEQLDNLERFRSKVATVYKSIDKDLEADKLYSEILNRIDIIGETLRQYYGVSMTPDPNIFNLPSIESILNIVGKVVESDVGIVRKLHTTWFSECEVGEVKNKVTVLSREVAMKGYKRGNLALPKGILADNVIVIDETNGRVSKSIKIKTPGKNEGVDKSYVIVNNITDFKQFLSSLGNESKIKSILRSVFRQEDVLSKVVGNGLQFIVVTPNGVKSNNKGKMEILLEDGVEFKATFKEVNTMDNIEDDCVLYFSKSVMNNPFSKKGVPMYVVV